MIKTWLIFALFVGMLLIVHGIYEEKMQALQRNVKVEYRFIPRTYYEEQLMNAEGTLSNTFRSMFQGVDAIADRRNLTES